MERIDEILIADERDDQSHGMQIATKHDIHLAPFFVVEDGDEVRTYTVYFKFVKEELESSLRATGTDGEDTLRANPDLDYI